MNGNRRPVVLVLQGAADAIRAPSAHHDVVIADDLEGVPSETADRVVAIVMRSGVRLGSAELDRMPALARVVRAGSGTDNVDLEQLSRRGVVFHRNAEASVEAVGEWALMATLVLVRRAAAGLIGIQHGQHLKASGMGRPLADHRLAIWGHGPVGAAVWKVMAPFVADVRFAAWPSLPDGVPRQLPDELNRWADIHVAALPHRAGTAAAFGPDWLATVADRRPHLVCVGRLETLDLSAVLAALADDRLAGLAIDPVEHSDVPTLRDAMSEPVNLFVSPHLGAQRLDVRMKLDAWVTERLADLPHLPAVGQ
ncbi:NAD(P)-dependent oxidoreductase [Nonomuraea sp. NPDC050451]|uniref:NAD(P)-dependent oxidoreductase n=1 Tax=Nonomuraea sp. NPDC050451 TaxID=3364364 RepID=UPI00378B793F